MGTAPWSPRWLGLPSRLCVRFGEGVSINALRVESTLVWGGAHTLA